MDLFGTWETHEVETEALVFARLSGEWAGVESELEATVQQAELHMRASGQVSRQISRQIRSTGRYHTGFFCYKLTPVSMFNNLNPPKKLGRWSCCENITHLGWGREKAELGGCQAVDKRPHLSAEDLQRHKLDLETFALRCDTESGSERAGINMASYYHERCGCAMCGPQGATAQFHRCYF